MRLIRWCIAGAGSLAVLFGGWYILQHLLNVDGAASWAAAGLAAGVAIAVLGWWAGLDGNRPTTASMVANTKIRIKRVRNSPIRIDVSPYRQEPRPRVPAPPVTGPVVVGDVPRQPPAFQTRDALLILPDDQMPRRQGHSLTYAITGMRGVGKTQLAAAQARRCIEGKWRLVAWINADTTATILNGLAEAAAVMGVQPGADEEASAKELRHLLETGGQRCLLVFDNAPDAAAVRPYLPAVGDACVLITSTSQSISSLGTSVAVGVFTEPEALSYLGERTTIDDDGQAAELAAEVGHLPLALAQAAAVIRAQHISYSTYLDRLRTLTAEEYLAPAGEDAYPLGAAAAIILALRAVQAADTSGLTVDLMRLLAVLSPAGVPRTILSAAGGRVMQRRWFLSVRRARPGAMAPAVDAALGDLAGASLLTFSLDGALVTAHRLTMRVIRERCLHEGDLEKVGAAAIDLLATAINAAEPTWQHIEAAKGLTEQIEALAVNLRPVLANSTGKLALELLELRGWALRCLTRLRDNPAQAISVGKALTVDLESALGADDMQTLTAINNLAGAYRSAGLVREGIPLFERAVDGLQRACGPDHPETLAALSNLGAAYRETEQLDKAIGVLEPALTGLERVCGPGHEHTLSTYSNLASAYLDADRLDEAIPMFERAYAGLTQTLGSLHPTSQSARGNLASAYRLTGRPDEAIRLLESTVKDRMSTAGKDHPSTLTAQNNLALAYLEADRVAEAIPLLEGTLADRERVLGLLHPGTLTSRNNLGYGYLKAGRASEAVPILQRAVADFERVLGKTSAATQDARQNLAEARQAARKAGRASVTSDAERPATQPRRKPRADPR